jgi:hypothetical protein
MFMDAVQVAHGDRAVGKERIDPIRDQLRRKLLDPNLTHKEKYGPGGAALVEHMIMQVGCVDHRVEPVADSDPSDS